MDDKIYVSYNDIHSAVKRLALLVTASGFKPDVIVAIGSGGFIPARILKTFINRPIYAVGISYYGIDNKPTELPQKIQWIDEVQQKLTGKNILLIDEVDDTRMTLSYCLEELLSHHPQEIAVLVIHNKKKRKQAAFPPEIHRYFAAFEVEDRWIRYPWDAECIEDHDLMAEKTRKAMKEDTQ